MLRWFLTICAISLGCGEQAKLAAPDAAADTGSLPGFGTRCDPATGCQKGLTCLDSDYSVKPFCALPCAAADVKNYCKDPVLGGRTGFCVQMPKDFQGPANPWCFPMCDNLAQCQTYDAQWELCAKATYKELPLVTDLPTKVCQSPSAHGQIRVDPVLCDWQDKAASDPKYGEAKQQCVALCKGLLKSCQLWPKGKTEDCCGWACFQWVTPGGKIDNSRLSGPIKCLVKAYQAFQDTPQICTGWQDQCGALPPWVQEK